MAISYQETDTAASMVGANWCYAGTGVGAPDLESLAAVGGTAGSTPVTTSTAASAADEKIAVFELIPAADVSWDAGTWVVPLRVTTANMNITVVTVMICRANSAGTNQATIGSSTGLSTSLGSTGVKTFNVTGSAQTPGVGDRVKIIIGVSNGAMSAQACGLTPSELIDTPFTISATPTTYSPLMMRSRMRTW